MAANDVLALEANFESWRKNRFPNPAKGTNPFEYYCIEQFARSFDLGDSQLKAGMVGGGGDGGIDAFYIFANGEMVDAETEIDPKDTPEFKLLIMQVKSDEGFSPAAVDKMYWFIDDLLDLSRKKADYHSTYHADLISLIRAFKDKLGIVVGDTPPLTIECIYVVKKDVQPNNDCEKSSAKIKERCVHYFPQAKAEFHFINATGLWKQVQTRPPRKKMLKWASQPMTVEAGDIGLVRLADFYEFLKDENGQIAERFFDSNVRGYWASSPINKRIAETLKSSDPTEFWLVNNGITILSEKTESTGGFLQIDIHDPQIVNGLQTSRQIYNHFSLNPSAGSPVQLADQRRVLVRIIKTTDEHIRDAVIRCTNSQNEMPEEALRATDAIHRQLETAFHTKGLYYDRRKGHYRDKGKPVLQIVSVIEVLQAMLSIVIQRPDEARARPRDYFKKNDQYNSVFGADRYPLTLYLKATEILRRVADFLSGKEIEAIHRRNIYFYLAMYACCEATTNAFADPGRIQQIDISKLTDTTLNACFDRVSEKYEKLAEKFEKDGERDYDTVAKGPQLLKALQTHLKQRFNRKKKVAAK
ncbi:MAG TPA: AIPR family protein [Verrucomicrobiae bacterium]|nr:AIPR family protein [Verrucomicrobiae bacterium]